MNIFYLLWVYMGAHGIVWYFYCVMEMFG